MAAEKGCTVVVVGGTLMVSRGGEMKDALKNTARDAQSTYKALNTAQGIRWLMRKMSGY